MSKTHLLICLIWAIMVSAFPASSQNRIIDSLEQRLKTLKGDERILTLGEICFQLNQMDAMRSVEYARELLKLAEKVNDPRLKAQAINDASIAYIAIGDFITAIKLNQEALLLRTAQKDTNGMVSSYSKIGHCQNEMARHTKSIKSYLTALHLLKHKNQPITEIQIFSNLASIYGSLGLYYEAYTMAKDASKLAKKLKHDVSIVTSQGNQANYARKLKRYKESLQLFKALIPICERNNFQELLATIYEGIGVTYYKMNKTSLAIEYYHKSFDNYKKIGSNYGIGSVAINLGHRYADLNQLDKAEEYYFIGNELLKKTGSYTQMKIATEGLTNLYKKKGDYKKALMYMELSKEYMDSTGASEGKQMMREMYAKYQTEKKQKEIVQQKLINAKQAKENLDNRLQLEMRRRWILGIGAVVVLLLIGLYFVYNTQRVKRKNEREALMLEGKLEQAQMGQQFAEEKLKISRELHDNIGSHLTFMISSVDNLVYQESQEEKIEKLKSISNFGRTTMKDLRTTIWAMKNDGGTLEELTMKLHELRNALQDQLRIEVETNADVQLQLNAMQLLNTYRIIQESLQNVLKYANATIMKIHMKQTNGEFSLECSDNGCGFDVTTNSDGNGLINMETRAHELGGKAKVVSEIGKGTTVMLTFPL